MAETSAIEWTDATWNPVTGCTKVSQGCAHCYAERMARRLQAMGQPRYERGFEVTLQHSVLPEPLAWGKRRMIFVCSMGDLFHEEVPTEYIRDVFSVMCQADRHIFQVLTKRAGRLSRLAPSLPWAPNIWAGVTVESAEYLCRAALLREVPAEVRFLSLEPLLGPIPDLPLDGMDWVIVGGESGPGARPMRPEWARDIKAQCKREQVAFFFKQWGGVHKTKNGRTLDGRKWSEMPEFCPA